MMQVVQTETFKNWFDGLRDSVAQSRILVRIGRLERGNFGDAKFFDGIGELRIPYGPGYRTLFHAPGRRGGPAAHWRGQVEPAPRHRPGEAAGQRGEGRWRKRSCRLT